MIRKNIKMQPVVERASTIRREVGIKEICELFPYGFVIGRLRGWALFSSGSTTWMAAMNRKITVEAPTYCQKFGSDCRWNFISETHVRKHKNVGSKSLLLHLQQSTDLLGHWIICIFKNTVLKSKMENHVYRDVFLESWTTLSAAIKDPNDNLYLSGSKLDSIIERVWKIDLLLNKTP